MKKFYLLLVLALVPLQLFAANNLKLNGSSDITITSLPTTVEMTCDFAQAGNYVEMEIYLDFNLNNNLDVNDQLVDFMILKDGIGWIRDSQDPNEDIPGDETGIDGKLKTTFDFDRDAIFVLGGRLFVKLKDQDGSIATASILFNIQPNPPYLEGKVTDNSTGAALSGINIFVDGEDDTYFGVTDVNGDYFINLSVGSYKVVASDFFKNEYQTSDTADVTLAAGEAKTQNFQLQGYNTFVDGTLKKDDGTLLPGISVFVTNQTTFDFSFGTSDANGYYKIGIDPGEIEVTASYLMNFGSEGWPQGYYVDPGSDTVNVASGQTETVDFTFYPYTAFIEGDCNVDNNPLSGVTIQAMSIDLQTGRFDISNTLSDDQGHYKVGVTPGMVQSLTATKEGYNVTSPQGGYFAIQVNAGQSVTGKDFTLTPIAGDMSISGQVTFENGSAANNVYVVAIQDDEDSPAGYQMAYTDGSGNYMFDQLFEGDWKVGVFKDGYGSTPPMFYQFLYPGIVITNANFVLGTGTDVTDLGDLLPNRFYLDQNYPNPFKVKGNISTTQIHFGLDKSSQTQIAIYNLNGQLIKKLQTGNLPAGKHQVMWNGRNELGEIVPSGIYFYRINTEDRILSKRLVIVR